MRVEVDDVDGLLERLEDRGADRMVAAENDWQHAGGQHVAHRAGDVVPRVFGIRRQDVDVADVDDPTIDELMFEVLAVVAAVVEPVGTEPHRMFTNPPWPETRAREERRAFVRRDTQDGDVGVEVGKIAPHRRA